MRLPSFEVFSLAFFRTRVTGSSIINHMGVLTHNTRRYCSGSPPPPSRESDTGERKANQTLTFYINETWGLTFPLAIKKKRQRHLFLPAYGAHRPRLSL